MTGNLWPLSRSIPKPRNLWTEESRSPEPRDSSVSTLLLNEAFEKQKKTSRNLKRSSLRNLPRNSPQNFPGFPGRKKIPPPPNFTRFFPSRFQISNQIPNQICTQKFHKHTSAGLAALILSSEILREKLKGNNTLFHTFFHTFSEFFPEDFPLQNKGV